MKRGLKVFRLAEVALLLLGVSLLGIASAGTVSRWKYQSEQERVLFEGGPAIPLPVADTSSRLSMPHPEAERQKAPPPVATPRRPEAFARLEIPRLGVKAIVKEGDDAKTLLRAVGLVPGSARPGEEGNIVLAGHRDTFFYPLQDVRTGDRIRLVVPPHTYRYEVGSVRIVEPTETSVLQSRGMEELTLVTCYPFHFVGPAPQRFIVSATRVN
jgi:sortase A